MWSIASRIFSELAIQSARLYPMEMLLSRGFDAGSPLYAALQPASHAFIREHDADFVDLKLIQLLMTHYEFVPTAPGGLTATAPAAGQPTNLLDRHVMLTGMPSAYVIARYGDIELARWWMDKVATIVELHRQDPVIKAAIPLLVLNATNAIHRSAGLQNEQLRILKATGLTFDTAETAINDYLTEFDGVSWDLSRSQGYTFMSKEFVVRTVKMNHFLLASNDLDVEQFSRWMPPPGENRNRDGSYDVAPMAVGLVKGEAASEVFRRLGLAENAIYAARVQIDRFPFNPYIRVFSNRTIGRAFSLLGRFPDAEQAFLDAVDEAHKIRAYFLEMTIGCDCIRELGLTKERLSVVGRALTHLVGPISIYASFLGPNVDGTMAVEVYRTSIAAAAFGGFAKAF